VSDYRSIKHLAKDDRPREKLMEQGRAVLSNAEILAILIGSGTKETSAVKLCQEILASVENDLNKLARLTVHDLTKFKGIGTAKAVTIAAALELGRRKQTLVAKNDRQITSARDVYQLMIQRLHDLNHEEFYILLLSRSNQVKSIELISKGGISGTVVDGKLVFKAALAQAASAIILCHNHPSGNLKPSQADIQLTKKLKEFGNMIDLPVLDHLIITDESYYSFADEGIF
jgi:DNA repair protein RadC